MMDDLWSDVSDVGDELVIELGVPRIPDLRVDLREDSIEVSGRRESAAQSCDGGCSQRRWMASSFRRIIPLPAHVMPEHARARFESGILSIEVPKAEGDKTNTGYGGGVRGPV